MAWIKRESNVEVTQELEFNNSQISITNAYEVEITECRLAKSKDTQSKSMSLVVGIKTEDGETARSFFTIMGRDGNTFFTGSVAGREVKKQHFGLSIANTLFKIVLGKEIFDVEPEEISYEVYNKDTKEKELVEGDGFPSLVGKKIGACVQMVRTIDGTNSKESPEIEHFFDISTGLFADEVADGKTKLDKWLAYAKPFKEIKKEVPKSAFGKKEVAEEAPKVSKWGKK